MKSERPSFWKRLLRRLRHDYIYKPAERRWIAYALEKTKDKEVKSYE